MRLKTGVNPKGLQPEILLAIMVADSLWRLHGAPELVVTSLNDSRHGDGSLHYKGLAADLRTHTVPIERRAELVTALRAALPPCYDVLHEFVGTIQEHIHVEYDPA